MNTSSANVGSSTSMGLMHPDYSATLPVTLIKGVLHGFETEGMYAHVAVYFNDPGRTCSIEKNKLVGVYDLVTNG